MTEDVKVAIGHTAEILTNSLHKRQTEGIELERKVRNFWDKIKKRLPAELATSMENQPNEEATKTAFVKQMEELMTAQNVKMSVVMFLFEQGIEL